MQLSRTRPAQWSNMLLALHASMLLDVRPLQIAESSLYTAFREGLDQALSPSHLSFNAVSYNIISAII
jgi:hypothetical protein